MTGARMVQLERLYSMIALHLSRSASRPATQRRAKTSAAVGQQFDGLQKIMGHDRHHDVQLKIAKAAAKGDGGVVAENLRADLQQHLAHHGVDLARHDGRTRLRGRQVQFAEAQRGPEPSNRMSLAILIEAHGDGLQRAGRFNDRIACRLGLQNGSRLRAESRPGFLPRCAQWCGGRNQGGY